MPRRPNLKRRLQIAELRAQGLSYGLIGQKLDVSRQCVHELLRRTEPLALIFITCCVCHDKIRQWRGRRPHPVFCRDCLPSDATFGQRLRTFRVAAGLTTRALAARAGIAGSSVSVYERGSQEPSEEHRAKLVRVIGQADGTDRTE
jgi:DNA-binding CsgD family transcriptional regulator